MRRFARLTAATLVAGAAIAAATALFADPASGAGPSPAAPQFCGRGTLALDNRSGSAPTLTHPGDYASVPVTLRNTTHTAVTDARLVLSVAGGRGRGSAGAPALRWRLDGGPWHQVALHKAFGRGYASDPMNLPRVTAGSTHTLRLGVAFHTGSPAGSYAVRATLRAGHCGSLLGFAQASYAYAPATPRSPSPEPSAKPKPHRHSGGARSPEPAPTAAGHPSAGTDTAAPDRHPTPTPSPSAAVPSLPSPIPSSPSPSASSSAPLPVTTLGGGPVAPIPTDAAGARALPDPVLGANRAALIIGGAGSLFIGASAITLVYLRRRRLI